MLNKSLLFLLPLIVSAAAFFFIEERSKVLQPQKSDEIDVFYRPGYSAINEIEILDSYINRISTAEEYLFFRDSVIESARKVVRDADAVAGGCDETVSVRLKLFLGSISQSIDVLMNEDSDDETRNAALLRIKADSWKLKDLIGHALHKRTEQSSINEALRYSELKKMNRNLFWILFTATFLMTVLASVFYRISKSSRKTAESSQKEPVRDDTAEEELTRKLNREQIISRRKGELLDTIPVGIFSSDNAGNLTYINKKMSEWFNAGPELAGDNVKVVFSRMGIDSADCGKFVFEGNIYWIMEKEINKEDFYFVRDITEQEELARKLLDSERLISIGEMASRITHEIRNPLSTIKLNSEYLAENVVELDDAQISASIELIVKEVVRLESITDKYMNMVRYRSNDESEVLTAMPVDLLQLVSFHMPEFEKRKIDVSIEKCGECTVSITLSSFKEIMLNLFKNAWEELPEGGKVVVTGNVAGNMIVIKIEDSGRGIPESEREAVFRNFYTKKPGGTGIGLSHSRKLAVEAGGKLYASGSSLGGACMVLELPLKNIN